MGCDVNDKEILKKGANVVRAIGVILLLFIHVSAWVFSVTSGGAIQFLAIMFTAFSGFLVIILIAYTISSIITAINDIGIDRRYTSIELSEESKFWHGVFRKLSGVKQNG